MGYFEDNIQKLDFFTRNLAFLKIITSMDIQTGSLLNIDFSRLSISC